MSVRAVILTRAKQVAIKDVDPKKGNFKYKDGLYVITNDAIANWEFEGEVKGSEIFWFEGNPNPITEEGIQDKSKTFMDDEVLVNALKQTSHGPRVDLGGLGDFISGLGSHFKSPSNVIWLLFYGIIAYALITGYLSGELF